MIYCNYSGHKDKWHLPGAFGFQGCLSNIKFDVLDNRVLSNLLGTTYFLIKAFSWWILTLLVPIFLRITRIFLFAKRKSYFNLFISVKIMISFVCLKTTTAWQWSKTTMFVSHMKMLTFLRKIKNADQSLRHNLPLLKWVTTCRDVGHIVTALK